jgi:CheY-like chemotaxis protein
VKPVRRLELFEAITAAMARHGNLRSAGEKPTAPDAVAVRSLQRPLRILLAEDARDNCTLIRAYLKNSLARIDEAENGLIAVEKAKTDKYDLVLMDIQMPVMDGLEAMRLIRQRERQDGAKRTPIIALTASALENDVRDSLYAGADLHVSKPVTKSWKRTQQTNGGSWPEPSGSRRCFSKLIHATRDVNSSAVPGTLAIRRGRATEY